MAIAASNLIVNQSGAGQTSYTTATVTPVANALTLLVVGNQVSAGTANIPTVTGAGMTWTQVATQLSSTTTLRRVTIFRALSASPGSGALTIDMAGQSQIRAGWVVDSLTGIDTTGTNGANAIIQSVGGDTTDSASSTGLSITLAAFSNTGNATYGGLRYGSGSATGLTAGSNFTQLAVVFGSASYQSEFAATNQTTVNWTWNSGSIFCEGIGLEIGVASSGGFNIAFV